MQGEGPEEMTDGRPTAVPDVVRTAESVEADEVFITLPTRDDDDEVQISRRPIYDALAQLSYSLCNGDGWAIDMPAIAWERLALGIDPDQTYTYSTHEEVLVDLYAMAALCVPNGWWPVEIDDPERGWGPHLEAWTFDEWNDCLRQRGSLTIDDPVAALEALAGVILNNPRAAAEYERRRTAGMLPVGVAMAPIDVRENG